MDRIVAGIDVGGTGIKGALVDLSAGKLITERVKILTPNPATPEAVARVVKKILDQLNWDGTVGMGFPAIVKKNVALSAGNISPEWIGVNVAELMLEKTGRRTSVANDADLAGYAEMELSNIDKSGVTIFLTIGTGIGSGFFLDGKLVPNTELGHLQFKSGIAEKYCSNMVKRNEKLSMKQWGKRFNEYLIYLDRLFSPNRYIIGGGISKKYDKFVNYIKTDTLIYPSKFFNEAGVLGAAMYVEEQLNTGI